MSHSPDGRVARWSSVAAAVLALMAGPARAQFVPEEVEVCASSARVYDPEFDAASGQMTYYDGRGGVRVAPVLADGRIGSPGCKGVLVSRGATISVPDLPFRAGPEWAVSARGLEIYFTRLNRQGRPYLARARFDAGWQIDRLPDTTDRGLALTSSDPTDPEPRLIYLRLPAPGAYELAWREASRPETEALLPGDVDPKTGGAPRWIPGRRALSYGLPDASGIRQAVVYDVDTGSVQYLTDDAGNKDEVWLWPAPEFGGAMAMMTVVDGCCLRFYRESDGAWQLYRELRAEEFSDRPRIFSPEPLVLDGRSYVVMQIAAQRVGRGGIWMVGMDPEGQPPLLLSDPDRPDVNRTEPEWHVGVDGVFVYVSASQGIDRFALNRLKTPLSPAAARR